MLASHPHDPDPLARLSRHHRQLIAYLRQTFPALEDDIVEELVQDAYANPATTAGCPSGLTEAQLVAWFQRVLRYDAIDYLRRLSGVRRGWIDEPARREASLDQIEAGTSFAAPMPSMNDVGVAGLERRDEIESFKRTIDSALARADPDTARLLRAKLAAEKPAAIALREGWSRKTYERRLTAAYKRIEAILASMRHGEHCVAVRELLVAAQDHLLADESQRIIGVHIEGCVHCRAFRRSLRSRIAALLPFPVPGVIARVLQRDGAAEVGGAVGGGGGAAAAGIMATAGGKAAATLCAGALIGGGCLTIARVVPRDQGGRPAARATATRDPTTAAAPSSPPERAATSLRRVAHVKPPARAGGRRAAEARRRRALRRRHAQRARASAARATAGSEGEFGPQASGSRSPAPPPTSQTATSRPAAPAPAPAAHPPTAPDLEPASPPSSSFSEEFAP